MPPPAAAPRGVSSKLTPGYWRRRIFKNVYTRKGHRFAVRAWSVKIQHAGRRKTLSLAAPTRSGAALEAEELYRRIVVGGWAALDSEKPVRAISPRAREFTVAFRWSDNPVVWTYATIRPQRGFGRKEAAANEGTTAVAVVEQDRSMRLALIGAVKQQSGLCSVVGYASPQEACSQLSRRPVQLILINRDLLREGAEFQELLRAAPRTAQLVYSVHADSDVLFRSTPSGAIGYLLKRTPPHQILDPIAGDVEEANRETIASCVQRYFQRLLNSWVRGDTAQALAKLTWREREILALLSQGNLDKNIADTLRISIWTVHGHLKNIYEKLGVHSRTEAVVKYLQK